MGAITVRQVTAENLADLELCVPRERRNELAFVTGMHEKRRWAVEMLQRWGTFARIAYRNTVPVGLVQYRPIPGDRAVFIYCIYVPERTHWRRGVGTRLLESLIEEVRKPHVWFDHQPARFLVTRTFPGEQTGQLPAHEFFLRRGFQPVDDGKTLFYPLEESIPIAEVKAVVGRGALESLFEERAGTYVPQAEDRGKALIIYGPSFCPFTYTFWLQGERQIKEIAPRLPIRWINAVAEPAEVTRRGGWVGWIVNASPIRAFVLDRDSFRREVREALEGIPPD
ncbi:MAG: GNAT family N-acetyltransferase [Armatimonadota bacterium]|nr:GNAT family N-acetyltransferase [Armatimonadota bacterium]MDR7426474.1 GNAT family N-acetyltransferase [Armatimonadota bacterium]MDR7463371.1 GNAT family N-acetyltransferase [Armatimonadota bacterium]MDR7468574.1 GNAT family N-acetyltransferase [Armatimonadota bacterium]MDR7475167.1 GNAT family N-acetyltransferase [Armatimonadota bacterium]